MCTVIACKPVSKVSITRPRTRLETGTLFSTRPDPLDRIDRPNSIGSIESARFISREQSSHDTEEEDVRDCEQWLAKVDQSFYSSILSIRDKRKTQMKYRERLMESLSLIAVGFSFSFPFIPKNSFYNSFPPFLLFFINLRNPDLIWKEKSKEEFKPRNRLTQNSPRERYVHYRLASLHEVLYTGIIFINHTEYT